MRQGKLVGGRTNVHPRVVENEIFNMDELA